MMNRFEGILRAIARLLEAGGPAVVAIDGPCGGGKTTLAGRISRAFPCNIIHMDDFYLPVPRRASDWRDVPTGNIDLDRVLNEILLPLRAGGTVTYRPFSCQTGQLGEPVALAPVPLTVVEGSYSQHPLLRPHYDLAVFLTCPREEQLRRLKEREGDSFPAFESTWMPLEERYFRQYGIQSVSDLIL